MNKIIAHVYWQAGGGHVSHIPSVKAAVLGHIYWWIVADSLARSRLWNFVVKQVFIVSFSIWRCRLMQKSHVVKEFLSSASSENARCDVLILQMNELSRLKTVRKRFDQNLGVWLRRQRSSKSNRQHRTAQIQYLYKTCWETSLFLHSPRSCRLMM